MSVVLKIIALIAELLFIFIFYCLCRAASLEDRWLEQNEFRNSGKKEAEDKKLHCSNSLQQESNRNST